MLGVIKRSADYVVHVLLMESKSAEI